MVVNVVVDVVVGIVVDGVVDAAVDRGFVAVSWLLASVVVRSA